MRSAERGCTSPLTNKRTCSVRLGRCSHVAVVTITTVLAVATFVTVMAVPEPAHAYCLTSYCPGVGPGETCTPSRDSDCGAPIRWGSPCMSYSLAQRASEEISLEEATSAVDRAFGSWMDAHCPGGGSPQLEVVSFGPVACDMHEYNREGGNANIISFREKDWPYEGLGTAVALTTLTYNVDTGIIYDADMELNAHGATLTTGKGHVEFDVQSIVTHEAGHFLGLAHSTDVDASMFAEYSAGTTGLRTLNADDVAAICAAYPPSPPVPASCDPTPRHGFSGACGGELVEPDPAACCTFAPGAPRAGGATASARARGALLALLLLGAMALRPRRRRRLS